MNLLGAGFILILTITLAGLAQYYKVLSEKLADSLLAAHAWVDEIIEALEDKDETEGNRAVDRLVAQRRDDERPGPSEH
ncbi:membrane protein [Streptomyces phage Vorvolakos]|uniref:Uncharacterized protein n=2 Tax=Flowerpowervirus flowerpower TaxID=2846396 RepID=A0A5P8D8U5_9CAUD|nr:hypothetical protein SEA_GEOSTIN_64 [Streptomyces phage Geostin]QFP94769.1 hypothetical protein SEA_FABIAN_68 [Streptomyces phage Fabian]QZD97115.1 membrane protein [Streptomyces phage RetrieverFever]UOW93301.1 membrane protein [Streptomyces phage Vorvolakos]